MPATRRLVLDLPEEIAAALESRVADGEFESVSAVVASLFIEDDVLPVLRTDTPEYQRWLKEGDELVARARRGEGRFTPAEQVFDELRRKLLLRAARELDAGAA